ncbi:RagB/SusD family nutrient uptake outer membrane protein [Mesonia aestuariivivens]|uniref:RagB/SusD family nutrient uptake outer membrane protein n=1 Tax=Mesonia aestuariivivens TaxID=2796128 RepID=A0ABS6W3D4_9FLAO|nr:RagB/SusD family nutrient uptake outer membrane protein [Mesonia aestuariivivens]MBW2962224.1 RagB/SusD family nutrient uptake outer membrane protein [Mesonia aestuariivivens]
MKLNKIKIFLASTGLLLGASCNDARDIVQDGIISDQNVWENVNDLQLGLNSVYGQYSFENQINFNGIFTDNIKRGTSSNGQGQGLYNFNLIPNTSEATSIYAGNYAGINYANRVLNGVETLEFEGAEQEQENNIEAQLLTLRAIFHFNLFQYYTEDYSDPNGLAIPIVDYVPEITATPERNTVSEVLAFINADLDRASELISSETVTGDYFYINANTINAVKAQVALIEANYQTAINLAEELVSKYPLSNTDEYTAMFRDEAQGEAIFSLARGQGDSQVAGLFYFNTVALDGDPYLEVSNGLYNELNSQDVRKEVIVGPESQYIGEDSENNILLINKYPGSVEPLINDIKLIRSSEMQLIIAEAKARLNDLAGAAQAIKELRDVRFGSTQPLPNYSNLNNALSEILKERRLEFAFEGKRYLDIKRIGKDINRGINRNSTDCASFSASCGLPRQDYRFTLPIPQLELNANSNITQNTGY